MPVPHGRRIRRAGAFLGFALTLAVPASAAANFPSSIAVTVPAGGTAQVSSPSLPPGAHEASVTVTSQGAGEGNPLDLLQMMLAEIPRKRDRVLFCVLMHQYSLDPAPMVPSFFDDEELAPLFMSMCVQMALLGPAKPRAAARAAAGARCRPSGVAVPMTVTRRGGRYHGTTGGVVKRVKRTKLRVTCQRRGGALVMKIRTRSRRQTLRQVVGDRLSLGFASLPGAAGGAPVRATFSRPR